MGEVVKLHYGKALPLDQRNPNGAIPVYGANGVKDTADNHFAEGPSLVIGRKGSAGQVTRVDGPFWPLDVTYFTSHDRSRLDFSFLQYSLANLKLPKLARGVKPGINRNEVYAQQIVLPPLEEQRQIVAVLDEAFEGLDRARAHAEANLRNAQELFDNVLKTIFSDIHANASRLRLSQAAVDFGRGRSRHRPRNDPTLYGGDYPFIQTGEIRNCNGTILDYSQTYNASGLAQSKLWPEGTVCITIAANIAETGVLGFDACFPDSVIGLVCDEKVTFPEYVEFMVRNFAADLKAQGKGSAQDNINLGTFEKSHYPFPPIERQRQIVDRLLQLSGEASAIGESYHDNLADLDDLRQSLLQRAIAGELT